MSQFVIIYPPVDNAVTIQIVIYGIIISGVGVTFTLLPTVVTLTGPHTGPHKVTTTLRVQVDFSEAARS